MQVDFLKSASLQWILVNLQGVAVLKSWILEWLHKVCDMIFEKIKKKTKNPKHQNSHPTTANNPKTLSLTAYPEATWWCFPDHKVVRSFYLC